MTLPRCPVCCQPLRAQGDVGSSTPTTCDACQSEGAAIGPESWQGRLRHSDPEATLAETKVGPPDDQLSMGRQFIPAIPTSAVPTSAVPTSAIPNPQPADRGPAAQRYEYIAHHASGGLGVVSIANDRELRRNVAIKQINEQFADDPQSRARFLAEAEITGQLEHPGIVPVYGLGTTRQGRPFYAMRFIDGQSLKEAVDSHHAAARGERQRLPTTAFGTIDFRRLVQSLISVCQAMEFAHSRGIIHRDLKPANIMLGQFGETFVVDWGLARSSQPLSEVSGRETVSVSMDTEQTQPGTAKGTPAYMSPEQARGDIEQLDQRSDVYSLGATLHYVLTGQPPFRARSHQQVVQRVIAGQFAGPEQVNPDSPRALSAICCKAMRTDPALRYCCARELAHDLESWLADERVSAVSPAWRDHLRWSMRRHTRLVTAVATAVLLSIIGLFLLARVLADRNDALTAQTTALTTAYRSESAARLEAARQKRAAAEQAQLAFDTLSITLDEIESRLQQLPVTSSLRKQMLERLMPALNDLATDLIDESSVDHLQIHSLHRLADTLVRFAPTGPFAEQPAADRSLPMWEQSSLQIAAQFSQLALQKAASQASDADSPQADYRLAASHRKRGEVAERLGHTDTAAKHYQNCQTLTDGILSADATNERALLLAAATNSDLGELQYLQGSIQRAGRSFDDAVELAATALANAHNSACLTQLAWALEKRADFLSRIKRSAQALPDQTRSLQLREQLLEQEPTDHNLHLLVARTQADLGETYRSLGQLSEAESALRTSLQRFDAARQADSADLFVAYNASIAMVTLSRLLDDSGKEREARRLIDDAISIRRQLTVRSPATFTFRRALAVSLQEAAEQAAAAGERSRAQTHLSEAVPIMQALAAEDPDNLQSCQDLAFTQKRMAELLLEQGRTDESMAVYRESLAVMRQLATLKQDQRTLGQLAAHLQSYGTALSRSDDSGDAIRHFEEAVTLRHDLIPSASPGTEHEYRYSLAITLERYGQALQRLNLPHEAVQQFMRAVEVERDLVAEHPSSLRYRRALMVGLSWTARLRSSLAESAPVLDLYRECESVAASMVRLRPDEYRPAEDHSIACRKLGEALRAAGELDTALQWLEQSAACVQPFVLAHSRHSDSRKALACALEECADVQSRLDLPERAIASYRQSLALRRGLMDKNRSHVPNRHRIASVCSDTARLYEQQHQFEEAARFFSEAAATLDALISENRAKPGLKALRDQFQGRADRATFSARATGDLSTLLTADEDDITALLEQRAIHFCHDGRTEAGIEAARLLLDRPDTTARLLYNAACVLSLSADRSAASRQPQLRQQACTALERAIQAGFSNVAVLDSDTDLDGIRSMPDFGKLRETLSDQVSP